MIEPLLLVLIKSNCALCDSSKNLFFDSITTALNAVGVEMKVVTVTHPDQAEIKWFFNKIMGKNLPMYIILDKSAFNSNGKQGDKNEFHTYEGNNLDLEGIMSWIKEKIDKIPDSVEKIDTTLDVIEKNETTFINQGIFFIYFSKGDIGLY